jgi:hypothetical protein
VGVHAAHTRRGHKAKPNGTCRKQAKPTRGVLAGFLIRRVDGRLLEQRHVLPSLNVDRPLSER